MTLNWKLCACACVTVVWTLPFVRANKTEPTQTPFAHRELCWLQNCVLYGTKSIIYTYTYNSIDLFALLYLPPLYTIYCVIVSLPPVFDDDSLCFGIFNDFLFAFNLCYGTM